MNKYQEELISAIQYIVSQNLKKERRAMVLDGVIVERFQDKYTVFIEDIEYYNIPSLNSQDFYKPGDRVLILTNNGHFADKIILGYKQGSSNPSSKIDKSSLPTSPVKILRENDDPTGRAYRFDYGFEGYPPEKAWSQVLHREDGKVLFISNHYSDGTIDYYYLVRNSADRVEYYGKNSNYSSTS